MFGFRFTGPDAATGLVVDRSGKLRQVDGGQELRQALVMLLSTRPGERGMIPEFGCPLDRLNFEPNDATTAGLAIRIVSDSIARFEKRAIVETLDAYADPHEPEKLIIDLGYRDARTQQRDRLLHHIPLDGGA